MSWAVSRAARSAAGSNSPRRCAVRENGINFKPHLRVLSSCPSGKTQPRQKFSVHQYLQMCTSLPGVVNYKIIRRSAFRRLGTSEFQFFQQTKQPMWTSSRGCSGCPRDSIQLHIWPKHTTGVPMSCDPRKPITFVV